MVQNGLLQQISSWVSLQIQLLGDLVSSALRGNGEAASWGDASCEQARDFNGSDPFFTARGALFEDWMGRPTIDLNEALGLPPRITDPLDD
jgi:hypothetical protein